MKPRVANKVLRTFISFLFVVHILVLIRFILLKDPGKLKSHFTNDYSLTLVRKSFCAGNYIPFSTVHFYLDGSRPLQYTTENLVGNILLFFPMGIFLPLLFNRIKNFTAVVAVSSVVSLCFESVQLITALGTFDVDDILLNVIGAAFGFGTLILFAALLGKKPITSQSNL